MRFPIGDWTLNPYGPYVGCMDGAAQKIDWMFNICSKYNIKILLDVHSVKGSANGLDNGGRAQKIVWKSEDEFSHWENQQANWLGDWNISEKKYDHLNYENVLWSLNVTENLLIRWGNHSAFYGFEPVNEPWEHTPLQVLKDFYREVRSQVQRYTANAYFVFHDAY